MMHREISRVGVCAEGEIVSTGPYSQDTRDDNGSACSAAEFIQLCIQERVAVRLDIADNKIVSASCALCNELSDYEDRIQPLLREVKVQAGNGRVS
jgi:hypothetical protein